MVKILIMGLPGSGKTTMAQSLKSKFESMFNTVDWLNADRVRQIHNDWDFSTEGRLRQATRMSSLAAQSISDVVICDFVCPTEESRAIFKADMTVWMDTIQRGRFEDTNTVFVAPLQYDFRVTDWINNEAVITEIAKRVNSAFFTAVL